MDVCTDKVTDGPQVKAILSFHINSINDRFGCLVHSTITEKNFNEICRNPKNVNKEVFYSLLFVNII